MTRLRVNTWVVVSRAVEEGAAIGYRRAFKHVDNPTEDQILEHIEREVMNALSEVLEFGGPDDLAR